MFPSKSSHPFLCCLTPRASKSSPSLLLSLRVRESSVAGRDRRQRVGEPLHERRGKILTLLGVNSTGLSSREGAFPRRRVPSSGRTAHASMCSIDAPPSRKRISGELDHVRFDSPMIGVRGKGIASGERQSPAASSMIAWVRRSPLSQSNFPCRTSGACQRGDDFSKRHFP